MALGNKGQVNWLAVIAVAAVVLFFWGDKLSAFTGGAGTTTTTTSNNVGEKIDQLLAQCNKEDTTVTIGTAQDFYRPNAKIGSAWHRVFTQEVKDGPFVDRGLIADGSTLTMDPGTNVEVYYGANSSTHYTAKQAFTVPCSGAVTTAAMPDSDAYKLYNHTNLPAIEFFNQDDGDLNSGANNETLAAGDSAAQTIRFTGQNEQAFSPYGDIIVTADGNKSVYDEVIFTGAFVKAKATTPTQHATQNSDSATWSYFVEPIKGVQVLSGTMLLDVSDTVDPISDSQDVLVRMFDVNWYQDRDTGAMILGYEDKSNGNTDVGAPNRNESFGVA